MLTDIGNLAAAIPGADAQGFDPSQLGAVSGAITDASIDVYSGEDDHVLRKLDVNLTIDPSAISRGRDPGRRTSRSQFRSRSTASTRTQTISAPTDAKPISELLGDSGLDPERARRLGGLGGGSLGGGPARRPGGGAAAA